MDGPDGITSFPRQVRAAREVSLPEEQMLARLASECAQERARLEETTLAVRQEQGDSAAQAQANWDRVHANSIEAIRRAYALRLAVLDGYILV